MHEKQPVSKKNPYYISSHRYLELKNFCLQYPEWKQAVADINLVGKPADIYVDTNMQDPTSKVADLREPYLKKIFLVESCASATDENYGKYVLMAVTRALTYDNLRLMHGLMINRREYYKLYRKFFYILSKKRN